MIVILSEYRYLRNGLLWARCRYPSLSTAGVLAIVFLCLFAPNTGDSQTYRLDNGYSSRLTNAIRANTIYGQAINGNPRTDFVVYLSKECEVLRVRLLSTSGDPSWDWAAERAVTRTSPFPMPTMGICPSSMLVSHQARVSSKDEELALYQQLRQDQVARMVSSGLQNCPSNRAWNNCIGKLPTSPDRVYRGEFQNNLPHGIGELTLSGRLAHSGQFRRGHPEGMGTLHFPDGTKFSGVFKAGVPLGDGVLRLADGSTRVGELNALATQARSERLPNTEPPVVQIPSDNRVASDVAVNIAATRRALVIGNDTYTKVDTLKNARADAKAIAKQLESHGFKVTTHLDLTERGMKEALRTFRTSVEGGDEIAVFFAGHGVQIGAANYLLPVDIRGESEEQIKDEAISLQRVLDDLSERKARFSLVIVDACRNNPFKGSGRSIGGRGLATSTVVSGQMVLYSAGAGQEAIDRLDAKDRDPNGLFTRVLLKEMAKPGISIDRVARNVRNQVAEIAKSVGREQVPALYDQTLGDFFFVR